MQSDRKALKVSEGFQSKDRQEHNLQLSALLPLRQTRHHAASQMQAIS
jgi:hypothetical protein